MATANGTGKTHISVALGTNLVNQGKRVRFHNAVDLINALIAVQAEGNTGKIIRQLTALDCVIIDELAYPRAGRPHQPRRRVFHVLSRYTDFTNPAHSDIVAEDFCSACLRHACADAGSRTGMAMNKPLFGGRVRRIATLSHTDARGTLTPIDLDPGDFQAVRAFCVTAPTGSTRGGHAHLRGRQILMRVSGVIAVELRWQGRAETLHLDQDRPALLIEPPVWARQTYLDASPALVVFCDTPYEPDDYLHEPV